MKTIIEDLILRTHTPKKNIWSFVMIIEIIIKVNTIDSNHIVSIKKNPHYDANLNRHTLRSNKQYWNTCSRKLKFIFFIETLTQWL